MIFAKNLDYSERLDFFDEVSSTQDYLKDTYTLQRLGRNFHWVRAQHQTAGRGRMGRKWEAKKASSLLCSVAINSELFVSSGAQALFLPFVCLLSLCETLKQWIPSSSDGLLAKWPNDVLWQSHTGAVKKLAGILVESKGGKVYTAGWGVNLLGNSELEVAISLEEILGTTFAPFMVDQFFHSLRLSFYKNLQSWFAVPKNFEIDLMEKLRTHWMKDFWGREIRVGEEKFLAIGLEDCGSLRCRALTGMDEKMISCSNNVEMDLA